jgi:hypothetical protein
MTRQKEKFFFFKITTCFFFSSSHVPALVKTTREDTNSKKVFFCVQKNKLWKKECSENPGGLKTFIDNFLGLKFSCSLENSKTIHKRETLPAVPAKHNKNICQ